MTAETQLRRKLGEALAELGVVDVDVQLDRPRNPEHGDWATNVAMVLASRLKKPPREVARLVLDRLDLAGAGVRDADIAGPGFINFRLSEAQLQSLLERVLTEDEAYGRKASDSPRRVMVEFVSANPTGPLHVAHGRGAALGDAIATLLAWTGDAAHREFYVNDAGVQIDRLAESVDARWRQLHGEDAPIPEGGYHGDYVAELAREAEDAFGAEPGHRPLPEPGHPGLR